MGSCHVVFILSCPLRLSLLLGLNNARQLISKIVYCYGWLSFFDGVAPWQLLLGFRGLLVSPWLHRRAYALRLVVNADFLLLLDRFVGLVSPMLLLLPGLLLPVDPTDLLFLCLHDLLHLDLALPLHDFVEAAEPLVFFLGGASVQTKRSVHREENKDILPRAAFVDDFGALLSRDLEYVLELDLMTGLLIFDVVENLQPR